MLKVYQNPEVSWNTWRNYAIAMAKNNKRPLSFKRFTRHVENHCVTISYKNSYLFGEMVERVLFVSHWSPKSTREGVELLAQTLDLDFQIILNVLPGMGGMLRRMGLHFHGEWEVDYPYLQMKEVFSNKTAPMGIEFEMEPTLYERMAIENGYNY